MPRDGSGRSDNAIKPGENTIHGTQGGVCSTTTSLIEYYPIQPFISRTDLFASQHSTATNKPPSQPKIYRAERAATPPVPEKGDGIEGVDVSGGGSRGLGTGQGWHANDPNKPPLVDQLTEGKK